MKSKGLSTNFEAQRAHKICLENLYPLTRKLFMFYFYALQSLKDKNLYFGYSNDLLQRVKEHNAGRVLSTKDRRPLKLVYYEAYRSEKDAREREVQIKRRAKAYISLKRRFKNSLFH